MSEASESMFDIPQAIDRGSLDAYQSAVRRAEEAIDRAKREIACLGIEEVFEEHPELLRIKIGGEYSTDDEGGSCYYMIVEAEVDKVASNGKEPPWDVDRFEGVVGSVLGSWAEHLDGMELSRADYATKLGEALMGAVGHARWEASRVHEALEKMVPATEKKKGGPRV